MQNAIQSPSALPSDFRVRIANADFWSTDDKETVFPTLFDAISEIKDFLSDASEAKMDYVPSDIELVCADGTMCTYAEILDYPNTEWLKTYGETGIGYWNAMIARRFHPLKKFVATITKTVEISIEAESQEAAEQIARDREADGYVSFDMEIAVRPILLGDNTITHWIYLLSEQCNVTVYESNQFPGRFGYTGCETDSFESLGAATQAAMLAYGMVEPVC